TLASLALFASLPACRRPLPTAQDREAIVRTQKAFHDALVRGDGSAAMDLLAPDAEILEMGVRETRAEYEGQHLPADIEFAREVPATRGATIVRQEGNVAWVSATGTCKGMFRGKPVDTENAELMVLFKKDDGWQIRAIHWSGHTRRPGQ
ncbi:MAG: nuclear transport factor 2 family protein, partial [Chthoniobacterales bacterium]